MKSIVTITTPTRFTAEVRGRRAVGLLRRAGVPHLYDHRPPSGGCACWTCPAARVADLLAAADVARGLRVVLQHEQASLL